MDTSSTPNDDWVSIEGPFDAKELQGLRKHRRIERLSLTKQPLVTAAIAKGLSGLSSVGWLRLWCTVTRTAMRHVISIPELEVLDVLEIRYPGKLENFVDAKTLRVFRCNHYMSEPDLLEVASLPNLEELGAQNAAISLRALDAFLRIPKLQHLDLECTEFDDAMASTLSSSVAIQGLDIGATRVTAKGLRHICKMSQLRSLDIWALKIAERDLDLLSQLPNLEYLSVGGYEGQIVLTSKRVLSRLEALPSLKRLWLDGIALSDSERRALEERYEYVRN